MKRKSTVVSGEEGSGLVLTLMVLLVLSVLGASIGVLTLGSFRLSDINRDDTSAYYIAEAGAKRAYEDAKKSAWTHYSEPSVQTMDFYYNLLDSEFEAVTYEFKQQFGDDSHAEIAFTASGSDPRTYTILSTGFVGNKKRVVEKTFTATWFGKVGGGELPALPENTVLLTRGDTEFENGSINGDIYTDATKDNSVRITGNPTFKNTTLFHLDLAKPEKFFTYQDWYKNDGKLPGIVARNHVINWQIYEDLFSRVEIPEQTKNTEKRTNITIEGGLTSYSLKLATKETYIPTLKALSNIPVNLELTQDNSVLFIDELVLNTSSFEIKDNKNVTIVVKNKLDIQNNASLNSKGLPRQLTLIYLGNDNVALGGWSKPVTNANIIFKKSDVTANTTNVNGVLYTGGKSVVLGGDTSNSSVMLIAPNAHVYMTGSYSIQGNVIADTFKMDGGTKLTYKVIDTTGFPLDSGGTIKPTLEDLITDGPIIEK